MEPHLSQNFANFTFMQVISIVNGNMNASIRHTSCELEERADRRHEAHEQNTNQDDISRKPLPFERDILVR